MYNMLKLCTSRWNVSGRLCLHREQQAGGRGAFFVDAVFISFLSLCPAQSGLTELYISTDPEGLGPLHQLPLTPRSAAAGGGGAFQEVQSLNKREPFRTRSPAAHKQKSLLPVSVTALIQAQTDPPAGEGGFPCCTSIATVRVHYIYVHLSWIGTSETFVFVR